MSASDRAELDRLARALAALLAEWWLRHPRADEATPNSASKTRDGKRGAR